MTVPRAPLIIVITVTFMFHSFFRSLASSRHLSFFSLSFMLLSGYYYKVLSFGRDYMICLYFNLCDSFSRTDDVKILLFIWSNLSFLHNSLWITLPTQSSLVLYSFCANLLHSLMWLIVSSLSLHNQHLLFCWVLSILTLIWLVLMELFCVTIGEIQFLSKCFLFLATYRFSRPRCFLLAV